MIRRFEKKGDCVCTNYTVFVLSDLRRFDSSTHSGNQSLISCSADSVESDPWQTLRPTLEDSISISISGTIKSNPIPFVVQDRVAWCRSITPDGRTADGRGKTRSSEKRDELLQCNRGKAVLVLAVYSMQCAMTGGVRI